MTIRNSWQSLILAFVATALLAGCSKDDKDKKEDPKSIKVIESLGGWLEGSPDQQVRMLRVTDIEGQPISQAQILVGDALDSPFPSNFLTSGTDGTFLAPEAWTSEQVVTISAPGFVRASFFAQVPNNQTFQLRLAEAQSKFELKGQGQGFQVKDNDNLADFALAMPLMNKQALFAFDMGMFISPLSDQVVVYGQKIDIPTNVMLPKQKESYGIFPVTLEKPQYRLFFQTPGLKKVFAARGQFPFKQVVQELQNKKSFIDLINYFTLQGGGLREVMISSPNQSLDVPVADLKFNQAKYFKSSDFANDEFMLAIPLSTYKGELMMTDIKNVPANTSFKLTTAAGEQPQLLVVVKKKAEQENIAGGRLTAAIIPFDDNVLPVLLPMMENPQVLGIGELKVSLPALPNNIQGVVTYSVLSSIESRTQGDMTFEVVSRLWEVYSNQWQAEIKLPVWPNDKMAAGKKRWEVTLAGSQQHKNIDLNPRLLETVTHATHGATDF